jgi:hypothetical protein
MCHRTSSTLWRRWQQTNDIAAARMHPVLFVS